MPRLSVIHADDELAPEENTERIWTCATPSLVQAIDDYHYENRFKTRSATVRQLIEYGLEFAKNKRMT